jgi:hypothetical protein
LNEDPLTCHLKSEICQFGFFSFIHPQHYPFTKCTNPIDNIDEAMKKNSWAGGKLLGEGK